MSTYRPTLGLTVLFAALVDGGYAALCWATDTWKDAAPSAHVTALALGAIGAAIAAIVVAPSWGKRSG